MRRDLGIEYVCDLCQYASHVDHGEIPDGMITVEACMVGGPRSGVSGNKWILHLCSDCIPYKKETMVRKNLVQKVIDLWRKNEH